MLSNLIFLVVRIKLAAFDWARILAVFISGKVRVSAVSSVSSVEMLFEITEYAFVFATHFAYSG